MWHDRVAGVSFRAREHRHFSAELNAY